MAWTLHPVPRPLEACSLRELAQAAGWAQPDDLAGVAFLIDDLSFAERGLCAACGEEPLNRFVAERAASTPCTTCGTGCHALPFYRHRPVPAAVVQSVLDLPLHCLGAAAPRSAVVRSADRAVLFRHAA